MVGCLLVADFADPKAVGDCHGRCPTVAIGHFIRMGKLSQEKSDLGRPV